MVSLFRCKRCLNLFTCSYPITNCSCNKYWDNGFLKCYCVECLGQTQDEYRCCKERKATKKDIVLYLLTH